MGSKGETIQDRSDYRSRTRHDQKGDGFAPWSEDDIAAYERRWPIGTRQRVWLDVLIYTGLRRGDAVRFGRQHVRNGVGTIKTEKTGTEVTLPILPVLAKTLEAGPCGDLTFIAGESGRPLTKESFGNRFRKACRDVGLSNRSAHGLRKAAATRAANAGATVAETRGDLWLARWNDGRALYSCCGSSPTVTRRYAQARPGTTGKDNRGRQLRRPPHIATIQQPHDSWLARPGGA